MLGRTRVTPKFLGFLREILRIGTAIGGGCLSRLHCAIFGSHGHACFQGSREARELLPWSVQIDVIVPSSQAWGFSGGNSLVLPNFCEVRHNCDRRLVVIREFDALSEHGRHSAISAAITRQYVAMASLFLALRDYDFGV